MGYQECFKHSFFPCFILYSQFVWNLKRFFPLELHHITKWGELWLCGSECGIFDSSPFFIAGYRNRQSKKPAQLCLVTNLSGFFFLYFYFSSFWRERGRNFPVLRCGAAMFNFLQCWVQDGKSMIKKVSISFFP